MSFCALCVHRFPHTLVQIRRLVQMPDIPSPVRCQPPVQVLGAKPRSPAGSVFLSSEPLLPS